MIRPARHVSRLLVSLPAVCTGIKDRAFRERHERCQELAADEHRECYRLENLLHDIAPYPRPNSIASLGVKRTERMSSEGEDVSSMSNHKLSRNDQDSRLAASRALALGLSRRAPFSYSPPCMALSSRKRIAPSLLLSAITKRMRPCEVSA